ncbi:DUF4440 domain-containing protein [Streptomyces sp. NPDC086787]|uniref:nuclear transport factor 2 family protein n=1 Tax=Streptomyces sp. NPDC086787 TaxID=3365759 RepID=UPI0037F44A32
MERTRQTERAADDIRQAIANELLLMDPRFRASQERVEQLLDPEFTEVGRSGRLWTRESMLAAMAADSESGPPDAPRPEPSLMSGTLLAPGLVHLTYETVLDGRRTRRSSVWREGAHGEAGAPGWRLYYHQGTPVPPDME